MIVRIKIVPDAEPNADGTWQAVDIELAPKAIAKWFDAERVFAPFMPAGYHVVQYDVIYETPAEVARFYEARNGR